MLTEVQGKPLRGILSQVQLHRDNGRATATLSSPDFLQGQEGRNEIVEGREIMTSVVKSIDVVEGQLVLVTANSSYIVEDDIGIWEETMKDTDIDWPECVPTSRSVTGLSGDKTTIGGYTTGQLKTMWDLWDNYMDDESKSPLRFHYDEIHKELNYRGEGEYCAV